MNMDLKLSILIVIGSLSSSSCFSADTYSCPGGVHLASGSVAADEIPSGYESLVSNSIIRLSGVSMYDGPPKEGAALMPSSSSSKGNVITWKFIGAYERGKWVSCDYADGLVRIIARTKDPVTSCVAKMRTVKPQGTLTGYFVCK
jgi:hypothetical protein